MRIEFDPAKVSYDKLVGELSVRKVFMVRREAADKVVLSH